MSASSPEGRASLRSNPVSRLRKDGPWLRLASLVLLGCLQAALASAQASNIFIHTFAGGALPAAGIEATSASLGQPIAVAVDKQGNVYAAFAVQSVVARIDAQTQEMTVIAGTGEQGYNGDHIAATAAQLNQPTGLAVDTAGDLYIADTQNQAVRKVSAATGIITTVAGVPGSGLKGNGNVTDGIAATAEYLAQPVSVAFDAAGNLYIADEGNGRVRVVSAATALITTFAGGVPMTCDPVCLPFNGDNIPATSAVLPAPAGIAFDSHGNLYIADHVQQLVRKVSASTGLITTVAGNTVPGYTGDNIPATSAELNFADCIGDCISLAVPAVAVDSSGDVYVADIGNGRVRKISAATGLITTVAGNGTPGYNGDGIPAAAAEISYPAGLALDAAGNFYIADVDNNRIRMVSAKTGLITTLAGTGWAANNGDGAPATDAELSYPMALAVDSSRNLYVWNGADGAILRVDATTGRTKRIAGNGTAGYNGDNIPATDAALSSAAFGSQCQQIGCPGLALAVDAVGDLYIADYANNRVRKVSAATGLVTTVAGTGSWGYNGDNIPAIAAQLNRPVGLALDAAGNLYIADVQNGRVRKVNAATGLITTIAGISGYSGYNGDNIPATSAAIVPEALAFDRAGNLYVACGDMVRKIAADTGIITTVAGSWDNPAASLADNIPATQASFSASSLAVDSAGDIYIADIGTQRVRQISAATGLITTLAGNGQEGYNGDNLLATAAQLGYLTALAVDSGNNVYFTESTNNRLRGLVPKRLIESGTQANIPRR